MNGYSEAQKERIVDDIYKKREAICPLDGAQIEFEIHRTISAEKIPSELSYHCPRCESFGFFEPAPAKKDNQWTETQIQGIIDDYWSSGCPRCPIDGTILDCNKIEETGSNQIIFFCAYCGREFISNTE
ncbi:MAG: hypothetical protein GF388_00150 [Candidatus Aegiribacteria sp.]|nr:hypothetical protein [Candidatus Aegiribacteria sp.]